MRGAQARSWTAQDVAESYAHWWREAGLHGATSDLPHGWLSEPANESAPIVAEAPRARVVEPAPAPPLRPAVSLPASGPMPGDLNAFRTWLAQDAAQPEAAWRGPLFLPPAAANARLLVLTDMPDEAASDGAMPLSGPAARFVEAMLAAIGLRAAEVAFAPLAMRRPPGGLIDETTVAALAARMRHYLGLACPQAALILGDRTSRALIAAQGTPEAGRLPHVNHAGGTLPAAALAGPELLMRRPTAKAASWQTLRLLHGVTG